MEPDDTFEFCYRREPMSGASGNRKLQREGEFVEAVKKDYEAELPSAREAFRNKRVVVSVIFNLPKPEVGKTNTGGKKDLDNLLKLVLDSLQPNVDAQGEHPGLNLIPSDEWVFRVEAVKRIVDRPEQLGTWVTISEFKTRKK